MSDNTLQHNKFSSRQSSRGTRRSTISNFGSRGNSSFGSQGRDFRTDIKIRQEKNIVKKDFINHDKIKHGQRETFEKQFMKKGDILRLRNGARKILKADLDSPIKNKSLLNKFSAGYGISKDDYLKIKKLLSNTIKKKSDVFSSMERRSFGEALKKINEQTLDKAINNVNSGVQTRLDAKISDIRRIEKKVDIALENVRKIRNKRNKTNSKESEEKVDLDVDNLRNQAKDLAI